MATITLKFGDVEIPVDAGLLEKVIGIAGAEVKIKVPVNGETLAPMAQLFPDKCGDTEVLDWSVEDGRLGLKSKTTQAFYRAQIGTVRELIECTESEVLDMKGMGDRSVGELVERLKQFGLTLKVAELQQVTLDNKPPIYWSVDDPRCGLDTWLITRLKEAELNEVWQIARLTKREFCRMPGLGRKAAMDFGKFLKRFGLSFGMSIDGPPEL